MHVKKREATLFLGMIHRLLRRSIPIITCPAALSTKPKAPNSTLSPGDCAARNTRIWGNIGMIYYVLGFQRDNGKENGNYYYRVQGLG